MPIVTAEGAPRRPPATRTFGEAAHQCGVDQWPTELGAVEVILIAADLAPTSEGRTQGDGATVEDGVLGAAGTNAYRLAPIQNASRKPEWTFPAGSRNRLPPTLRRGLQQTADTASTEGSPDREISPAKWLHDINIASAGYSHITHLSNSHRAQPR